MPTCSGSPPTPHPACIYPSWAAPYATKITGTHTQLTKKSFHHNPASGGIYSYETYTITLTYADTPQDVPIPDAARSYPVPESRARRRFPLYGTYVAGQHLLEALPSGFGQTSLSCSPSGTRCVLDYNAYPHQFHGRLDLVFGLTVGELTKNPKGYGPWDAGFEFAAPLNIPALAK